MKNKNDKKRSIKALVTDIDGSITDEKRRISTQAIEALRTVEGKGIPVMLASGNVLPIAFGLASFIGTSGPVIAENGGVVYHNKEVRYLANRKRCDEAFEVLKDHLPVEKIFTDRWRRSELAIAADVDLKKVRQVISQFGLRAESTGFAIHIFLPEVGKFSGLAAACELMSIDVLDVCAFGDSENDIDMVKGCGLGMAPSNAIPGVKVNADFVASLPDGQGLVQGLRWLGVLH